MVEHLQIMIGHTTKSSVLTIFLFIFFKIMHHTFLKNIQILSKWAGYNINMCQHVYRYVGPGPCPYCGLDTHDPDWDKINKLYSEYREKMGFFYNTTTWWSI
jgi:hypothetical protein